MFKAIPGHTLTYAVSEKGVVKRIDGKHKVSIGKENDAIIKQNISNRSLYVHLTHQDFISRNGSLVPLLCNKKIAVQILVAKTYIPNPLNKNYVAFKDGNKLNCNSNNLYWTNKKPRQQSRHPLLGSKKSKETKLKMSLAKKGVSNKFYFCLGKKYLSLSLAANSLNVNKSTILRRCNNPSNLDYYSLDKSLLNLQQPTN